MAAASSYEEMRKNRLEENKRKIEELKLAHISASLREAIAAPKRSLGRPVKRKAFEPVVLRRSERVASLHEQPKYRDNRGYSEGHSEYAIKKATELKESLGSAFPTFVKPMLRSCVTGASWLRLPTEFGRKHLPKKD